MRVFEKLGLCLVLLTAWGCDENKTDDKTLGNGDDAEEYFLQIDGDTAHYTNKLLFKSDDPAAKIESEDVTKIVFSYPQFTDSKLSPQAEDSINRAIQAFLLLNGAGELSFASLEERMDDFIRQYLEDKEMSSGLGWGADGSWVCDVQVQVLANTPRLLSLQVSEHNFTGGAHGNKQVRYLNFDAKTGKQLVLQDLFSVEIEQLLPIAERRFRKKAQIPDNIPITDTEYEFLSGHFELPENMGITRKSLIFRYDAYELGKNEPFAFEVPLKDVLPLLNKKIMY